MYRLMVVDDEPVIADGLYEMLKEMDGFEVEVYKAYSGYEALVVLNAKKIDLVVTDICMQGMNGLELVDKIRGNWPECKIVFLTGHDQFDYAYRALQFDGVSYLLKNEDYEKIIDTVRKHLTDLEKSFQDERLILHAKDQIEKAIPLLRKELLMDIIEYGDHAALGERLAELGVGLSADRPVMLIIGCRHGNGEGERSIKSGSADEDYAISLIAERFLSRYVLTAETVYRRRYFVWFAQPTADVESTDWGMTSVFIKGALELAQQACLQSLGLHLSFIIGSEPIEWGAVADKFPFMHSVLNQRLRQGSDILLATDEFYRNDAGNRFYSDGQARRLQKQLIHLESLELLLDQGLSESFFEAYGQFREALATTSVEQRSMLHEIKQRITLFFISFINKYNLAGELGEEFDLDSLMSGYPALTLEETFDRCGRLAESIFGIRAADQERRSMTAILQVKQYIQEHLHADLSLTSLADKVYFNPKYFSRLFRQTTGAYLSDYIHERRLMKAKEMLTLPRIKIHEVGAAIGYQSASYFTRFFKKAMQMSPQEYRDSRHNAHALEQHAGE